MDLSKKDRLEPLSATGSMAMTKHIRLYQENDFAGVLSLANAATQADGDLWQLSEADLRSQLATPHADPRLALDQDAFVAEVDGDGVVAYADGVLMGNSTDWIYRTRGYVHPDFRRRGIGQALLERQWERLKTISDQLDGAKITFGARILDSQAGAKVLFERFSMKPARYFFTMQRDLTQPIPPPEPLTGLALRSWAEGGPNRAVWAAQQEAFADHWGFHTETFEMFDRRIQLGRIRIEGSTIAWDGDQIAGGSLNEIAPSLAAQAKPAWVGILFVRRPWRKRGLGRALLLTSMLAARQAGYSTIVLNVDAENLTGAVRLYKSVGFSPATTRVIYDRVYTP